VPSVRTAPVAQTLFAISLLNLLKGGKMRRNHKLESELAEEIVGYVIVNTDDYFAAEKALAQQTNNSAMDAIAVLADKWCDSTNQPDNVCIALYQFTSWARQQHQ